MKSRVNPGRNWRLVVNGREIENGFQPAQVSQIVIN